MYNQDFQVQDSDSNISSAVKPESQSNITVPRLDVIKNENDIVYAFEIPGINPDSLKVEMEENKLFVNARVTHPDSSEQILHKERISGEYYRQITINPDINVDSITADYNNGILYVKFPH